MESLQRISKDKLLAAGYEFLRTDDFGGPKGDEPKIKVCSRFGSWRTLKRYKTKKERDAAMRDLVESKESKYLVID